MRIGAVRAERDAPSRLDSPRPPALASGELGAARYGACSWLDMLRAFLDRRLVLCAVMSASVHACTVASDDTLMRDVEREVEPPDDSHDEPRDDAEPVEEVSPPAEVGDAGGGASMPPKPGATTSIPIVVSLIPNSAENRSGQKFGGQPLYITVHETNNPRSNAFGERAFFHSGGGDAKVAVHFAVDDVRAVQLLPLDEIGKHSGTVEGNRTSIAIETCVATNMSFAKVRVKPRAADRAHRRERSVDRLGRRLDERSVQPRAPSHAQRLGARQPLPPAHPQGGLLADAPRLDRRGVAAAPAVSPRDGASRSSHPLGRLEAHGTLDVAA